MNWLRINLHGAARIARVCGTYEVQDPLRVPDGKFKVKVLQRGESDFLALANICVRTDNGTPDWTSGSGATEADALEGLLRALGADLDAPEVEELLSAESLRKTEVVLDDGFPARHALSGVDQQRPPTAAAQIDGCRQSR